MSDRDVLYEALSLLCKTSVTAKDSDATTPLLGIVGFISALMGWSPMPRRPMVINEEEFFDPKYDFDFTDVEDTKTYYRGEEVYQRPCGWKRFALKVLDKYPDGNAWLGERGRRTTRSSREGEWPVSYHGTSTRGAQGIIISHYQPGPGEAHGRGIYSTPFLSEAVNYTRSFTSAKTGKKYQVVLQNRVNPEYREKHKKDKYWLVPIGNELSKKQEEELVNKAIRPYAILLKQL